MALSGAQVTQHGLAGYSQVLYGDFSAKSGGPDVTAPEPSSAVNDETTLTLTLTEAIQAGSSFVSGTANGFTVTATTGGDPILLTLTSGGISGSNLSFSTSRTISDTEVFTIGFSGAANIIEDLTGNDLAAFSGQAVTNNSAANSAPTDLILSGSTVLTTAGLNANVGTFSTTDPDAGDTFTYTLVAGTGDTDNAAFSISGATLRVDDPSGMSGPYSIRVQTEDSATNTRAEVFQITVSAPGTRAIIMNPVQSPIGEIVVNPVVT